MTDTPAEPGKHLRLVATNTVKEAGPWWLDERGLDLIESLAGKHAMDAVNPIAVIAIIRELRTLRHYMALLKATSPLRPAPK